MPDKICKVNGCNRMGKIVCGLCMMHYQRWSRHGDPNFVEKRGTGIRKHRLYGAWAGMVNRCHNPNNASYPLYGGRGIYVCNRWRRRNGFTAWLSDMGERPEGMTLDRINSDGPYSPDNCRWATATEQRANNSEGGAARQRAGARAGANRRWASVEARQAASEATRQQWAKRRAAE